MSRKVRICTISMNSQLYRAESTREDHLKDAEAKMKRGALDEPDLFLLPETFLVNPGAGRYGNPDNIDEEGNLFYERLGAAAAAYNAYVAAPLIIRKAGKVHNAAVVFDRSGKPVFDYAKTHPTQTELDQGVVPGPRQPETFDADFGRVGLAICYDLNFQHLFRHYYDRGVEVLLFSSYFPGGMLLRSWCFLYNFFAVSSHAQGYESVFIDNMGFEVARADMFAQALTHEFELDSVVTSHYDKEKMQTAKEKYGPDLDIRVQRPEGQTVIRYLGSDTTVRDIMAEFGFRTKAEVFENDHLL